MNEWQVAEVLKADSFGCVERLEGPGGSLIRRVVGGGRIPGSNFVARRLLNRERRTLEALDGLEGVPQLAHEPGACAAIRAGDAPPRAADILVRGFVRGAPLHQAEELAEDFFDHLDALVHALHERGVCHNDLHKEQNIVVGEDAFPHLIDFQLSSVHRGRGWLFASRVRDDLRHVQKHRRRYTRDGRGPHSASAEFGKGHGMRRGGVALVWRKSGKPLYNFVTRKLLRTSDGEERRPSSGPWPSWVAARGQRGERA